MSQIREVVISKLTLTLPSGHPPFEVPKKYYHLIQKKILKPGKHVVKFPIKDVRRQKMASDFVKDYPQFKWDVTALGTKEY